MSGEDELEEAPGWDAIDAALEPIYGTQEPKHWGTVVPYGLGGNDPLTGISAYRSEKHRHHLHYVTYGLTELYEKESENLEYSGFGFELTMRLAWEPNQDPPNFAINFLQNLARYVFETGNIFGVGHTMPLNGPIQQGADTPIHAIAFALDEELGRIDTPNGKVEFLQIVGLTEDERNAARLWNTERFLDLVRERNPMLLTALTRSSYLDDPVFRETVATKTAEEGSSSEAVATDRIVVQCDDNKFRLVVGSLVATDLASWLNSRLPQGKDFRIETEECIVWFRPADQLGWETDEEDVTLQLNESHTAAVVAVLNAGVGIHTHPELPGITIEIERTEITDSEGNVVDIIE